MSREEALRRIQQITAPQAVLFNLAKELDLRGCTLDLLPPEITALTQLTHLRLSETKLTNLPPEIAALTQLTHLDLSGTNLMSLPPEIAALTQLTHLDLSGTNLTSLSPEVTTFTQLTELHLSRTKLTNLPPEIAALTQLTHLDLSGTSLMSLPPEIAALTQLTHLDLSDTSMTSLPPEIAALTRLNILKLNRTRLTSLPPEIAALTWLSQLYLNRTRLTSLPPEIAALIQLSQLYLNRSNITSLPPEIASFTLLTTLDLSHTDMTSLPPEIGALIQLTSLNLTCTLLTSLPTELSNLTQLRELDTTGTVLDIPTEFLPRTGNYTPLRTYLRQRSEAGAFPLNEAKLILVGEGTVGKTSLVNQLIHGTFDPAEAKTEGIAIEPWRFPLNEGELRLNVWDFGGQEIMHATHQFFLTKRSIYLIVLNCRDTDHTNRLDYWLKLVQSFAPDAPIIVVGNKADQHPLDLDQRGLMLKYQQIQKFIATSCLTGLGIDTLRSTILEHLQRLKHVRDILPAAWWRVKRHVEQWQRDYISHDQFQDLCAAQGIEESLVRTILLGLLNDLGTVLSYHDDPRLAETNVLNPEWVTNGVYTILNYKPLLETRSGILTTADLTTILSVHGSRYPSHKCHFITDMMEKFELCFSIGRDHWLLPDLLPREQPDTGTWDDALHFVYRYPVLPSSIIARCIVRSQHAIEGTLRWRTGVVIRANDNRALIKSDPDDGRIDIRITGDRSNRRRLLSAIRYTFQQIHASLSGLTPEIQELVPLPGYPDRLVEYADLLSCEAMNEQEYLDLKLRKRFPITHLLDGYETPTERQARHVDRYQTAPPEDLQALLETKEAHLHTYEQQRASFGDLHVPPYIVHEMDNLIRQITHLRAVIKQRGGNNGKS